MEDAYKPYYRDAVEEIRKKDDQIHTLTVAVARLQWACKQVLEQKFSTETIGQDVCLQMVEKILIETQEDTNEEA